MHEFCAPGLNANQERIHRMKMTTQYLEEQLRAGKIKGISFPEKAKKCSAKTGKNIPAAKGNKTKGWIQLQLEAWAKAQNIQLETEFKFHPVRKWRFDWCFPEIKVAIEYEGLAFHRTHHTSSEGYTKNAEKYNAAAGIGWMVYRYTYKNYKSIIEDLNNILK